MVDPDPILGPPMNILRKSVANRCSTCFALAATTSTSPFESAPPKPSGKSTAQLETLLAAGLTVHTTFLQRSKQLSLVTHTEAYLELAKSAPRSPHVMGAVADFLELVRR